MGLIKNVNSKLSLNLRAVKIAKFSIFYQYLRLGLFLFVFVKSFVWNVWLLQYIHIINIVHVSSCRQHNELHIVVSIFI